MRSGKIFVRYVFIAVSAFFFVFCNPSLCQRVRVGAEVLLEQYLPLLEGERVGVICNHTSLLPNGVHLVDTLLKRGVKITALFAPEHGIRGELSAGERVGSQTDSKTGLRVHSLYGGTKKPTVEMLLDVDVLMFDMQDAGARFYTYISTMGYCLMAAGENGKKFYLLDRPNPINGIDIEGPVLELEYRSFVGLYPIPVRYGMTAGELAKMIIGEGFVNPSTADLAVIPMEGWERPMWYDETGLPWIPPSPNMRTVSTATVYPGTCFFEATNFTEGRGTEKPFEYIGIPGFNGVAAASALNDLNLPGVTFLPVEFTPRGKEAGKFRERKCGGIFVKVTDRKAFKPVLTGVMMIAKFKQLYREKFLIKKGRFDHLIGEERTSGILEAGSGFMKNLSVDGVSMQRFEKLRLKYLLY